MLRAGGGEGRRGAGEEKATRTSLGEEPRHFSQQATSRKAHDLDSGMRSEGSKFELGF